MSLKIENGEETWGKKSVGEIGYGVMERQELGIINSDLGTYIQILRFPKTSPVSWPCLSEDEGAFPMYILLLRQAGKKGEWTSVC